MVLILTLQARAVFEKGQKNVEIRKQKAAKDLAIQPPHPDEMNVVHALFLLSKHIADVNEYARDKESRNASAMETLPMVTASASTATQLNTPEMLAISSMIREGRYTWMKNTVFKNTQFMHAQVSSVI